MHGNGTGVYQGMSERVGWPVQTFHVADLTERLCLKVHLCFYDCITWYAWYIGFKNDRECAHILFITFDSLANIQGWKILKHSACLWCESVNCNGLVSSNYTSNQMLKPSRGWFKECFQHRLFFKYGNLNIISSLKSPGIQWKTNLSS